MTDTPTRDEIRAAVAYGQQLAVRRILDDLAKERPLAPGFQVASALAFGTDEQREVAQRIEADVHRGFDRATAVVKRYQVDDSGVIPREWPPEATHAMQSDEHAAQVPTGTPAPENGSESLTALLARYDELRTKDISIDPDAINDATWDGDDE